MTGLGTIINVAGVIVGGVIGMLVKNGLKERYQSILMQACGVSTIFIGAGGAMQGILKLTESGALETANTMLIVLSFVLGGLLGELIDLETKMEKFGTWLRKLVKDKSGSRFVDGFVTTSLVICIGAMAIVGSINDGLTGDFSMLASKAVLDLIIVMVFASTFGVGCLFAAIPLALWQGGITLFASLIAGVIEGNASLIANLSLIGSILIFCVGVNIAFGKKLKVGNLLPAMIFPVIYSFIF